MIRQIRRQWLRLRARRVAAHRERIETDWFIAAIRRTR